jgi:putative transposase
MARPLRIQFPGAFYHITCRGNERKVIFSDQNDQDTFLEKLSLSLEIFNVSLLAYVLMPNHFHLLLTTPEGNLSEFMRHFNISYTSAFNRRHKRVGHLYQGRYKAFVIHADNYLLEVSRYIHLNPIRIKILRKEPFKKIWERLVKHKGSSLPGYLTLKKSNDFMDYGALLGYMEGDNRRGREKYRKFLQDGIGQKIENPLLLGKGSGIVGGVDFVKWIKEKVVGKEISHREYPALREIRKKYEAEELIKAFGQIVNKGKEELCQRGTRTVERAMLMELLYRYSKLSQPKIGNIIGGIDYSSVSQARKRLRVQMEKDRRLKKRFEKISDELEKLSREKI